MERRLSASLIWALIRVSSTVAALPTDAPLRLPHFSPAAAPRQQSHRPGVGSLLLPLDFAQNDTEAASNAARYIEKKENRMKPTISARMMMMTG